MATNRIFVADRRPASGHSFIAQPFYPLRYGRYGLGWFILLTLVGPISAQQDFSIREAAAKLSPSRLFNRADDNNSAGPTVTKPGNQPAELKVIDRATAKRMAISDPTTGSTSTPSTNDWNAPVRLAQVYDEPEQPRYARTTDSAGVDRVSYQQPMKRVYNSPSHPVAPAHENPYDYPPNHYPGNYPPNGSAGYPRNYQPDYPTAPFQGNAPGYAPYNNAPNGNLSRPLGRLPELPDQNGYSPAEFTDQPLSHPHYQQPHSLASPRELMLDEAVPANPIRSVAQPAVENRTQDYANEPPMYDERQTQYAPASSQDNFGMYASDQYPAGFEEGYSAGAGRGYLQNGMGLQGRQLQSHPKTATDRALELHNENQRLREFVARTRVELENRTQELVATKTAFRSKEEELVRTLNRVNELDAQLVRLTSELKVAIQEKVSIQRHAEEQLKTIESSLDGLLMNSISQGEK